jgi:PST family polysaccharide transporter
MALSLNIGAGLFLVIFSPVAGILFNQPRVIVLLLAASIALPIQSLSTIYFAALQRDLRFRRVAMIQCVSGALQNGFAVLLAWLGVGALSVVLPLTLTAVWMATACRLSAGKIPLGRPNPRSWRALGNPAAWLMIHALFTALLASGSSVVIGLIQHDAATLGYFYWGFAMSSQAVFLMVTNLQSVLFPVLQKLNAEPDRQFIAVERAARTLLLVVAPICLLQWLLAGPLISSLFHSRWEPAIPVVEWISIGLLSQPLYLLTVSVLLARGRFRRLALTTGFVAAVTVAAATVGAFIGDQAAIARCAGCALLVSNLVAGWVTVREFGRGWRQLLNLIAPVVVIALLVATLGWWTSRATSTAGTAIQVMATTGTVLWFEG